MPEFSTANVMKFVDEELNFYPTDCPTLEEKIHSLTPWKAWIWLEQHGFDFASVSISYQINSHFQLQQPVSTADERLLLSRIRGVARESCGMPASATAPDSASPTDLYQTWLHLGPFRSTKSDHFVSDDKIDSFIHSIQNDHSIYLEILQKAHQQCDSNKIIKYDDSLVGNGHYELSINKHFVNVAARLMLLDLFLSKFTVAFGRGDLNLFNRAFERYIESAR